MPAEVISLLSSPLREAQPSSSQSSLPRAPYPLRQSKPRGIGRSLDHDVVDLTSDTPDRNPWSHQPPARGPAQPNSRNDRPDLAGVNRTLCLSDDFDTTGDFDGGDAGSPFDSRATKKPRLSNGRDGSTVGGACSPLAKLPILGNTSQPSRSRRLHSVADLDPVEFSSSPLTAVKSTTRTQGLLDSSLFASSSPAGKGADRNEDAAVRPMASAFREYDRSPKRPVAWDPISSSAPQQSFDNEPPGSPRRGLHRSMSEVIAVDDSAGDTASSSGDEFPDVGKVQSRRRKPKPGRGQPMPKVKRVARAPAGPKKSAEEKAKEKEVREAEKERKRQEKEEAKQQRTLEKERAAALAEVNKVRIDKKVSTPEMIVHLPLSLGETTTLQAETLLDGLGVQHESWASPVDNVVKWSRKVKSRYNEELEHWEPIPMRVEPEKYAMVVLLAAEFVKLVLKEENTDVEAHVAGMQSHFPDHTLIYLVEGLTPWMRKNRTIRNRQFVSAVRSGLAEDASAAAPPSSSQPQATAASRRKRTATAPKAYVDEDAVEDALLNLQVLHGALIHHTAVALETAHQIVTFTQHVSTVPYRRQRDDANAASATFCMEAGQVRAGDGTHDTYVRMLQEVARVTAPIAYGVAAEFASVAELVRGLEDRGPLALEDVRKSANKDGAFSDRRVGQAVSRRLYKVFTGRDERSMDV